MNNMRCKIRLSGSNMLDVNVNLSITIMEMLRNSMYVMIHNMGVIIKREHPELIQETVGEDEMVDQCIVGIFLSRNG